MEVPVVIRLLLCLASLAAFAAAACAQQPAASPRAPAGKNADTSEHRDWPSPDGNFAFVTTYGEDPPTTIDLIDTQSGKRLQRIGEEDSSQVYWHVRWAPNSNRFALMTRIGHPIQGLDVYFRRGRTFRKLELPPLPDANIPEKLKHGKNFPHYANLNWQEARRWKKDGSLVLTIVTAIDGDGSSITATRTVVLGFDRGGKAGILKSAIKYEAETD
jgi:hypothetical protein